MADNKVTQSIDPRERYHDSEEQLRVAFEGMQSALWTAMPVIVQAYNADLQTVKLQPTIKALQRDQYGNLTLVNMPQLLDCPVLFPTGGGFTLTFPIAAGDEGLAIFSSRCPDNWWQNGGIQPPYDLTMHDLSHGFYIPGCRSNPRALGGVSGTTTQLRSDDGTTFVEVAGGGIVTVTAPTQINLNSPIVNVAGVITVQNENSVANSFTVNGTIIATGDVQSLSGAHKLSTHIHNGVSTGGGNTGMPIT